MKIRKVNRLILSEEERQVLKNASILIGQIDQVMARTMKLMTIFRLKI